MNKLFAFNVSKEVVDLPTASFLYDPNEQVTTLIGSATTLAVYCTQAPYRGTKCKIGSNGMGGQWCVTPGDPAGYTLYNTKCD